MALRPHSQQTRSDALGYLDELATVHAENLTALKKSSAFIELFKATLAGDASMASLSGKEPRDLTAVRAPMRAVLVLASTGHTRSAQVELRRTIEAVVTAGYFQDHPVEFARVKAQPRHGFETDPKKPISFAAFREFSFYANYCLERLTPEPSGLALPALKVLTAEYGNMSAMVHAPAALPASYLPESLEITEPSLAALSKLARSVFAASALVVAAARRDAFNALPAMSRGWFEWLIGTTRAKQLRSGPFGLS